MGKTLQACGSLQQEVVWGVDRPWAAVCGCSAPTIKGGMWLMRKRGAGEITRCHSLQCPNNGLLL